MRIGMLDSPVTWGRGIQPNSCCFEAGQHRQGNRVSAELAIRLIPRRPPGPPGGCGCGSAAGRPRRRRCSSCRWKEHPPRRLPNLTFLAAAAPLLILQVGRTSCAASSSRSLLPSGALALAFAPHACLPGHAWVGAA